MALLQGTKKLFGPLLDDLDCVSAVKEAMELQVETACDGALQRTTKLFSPLLDDLDCVSAVKEAMESQVRAYMRWRCFKGPRSCSALC
jgi:hypothetical protein